MLVIADNNAVSRMLQAEIRAPNQRADRRQTTHTNSAPAFKQKFLAK